MENVQNVDEMMGVLLLQKIVLLCLLPLIVTQMSDFI